MRAGLVARALPYCHRGEATAPRFVVWRASLEILPVKSSTRERNIFRIGDVFAL